MLAYDIRLIDRMPAEITTKEEKRRRRVLASVPPTAPDQSPVGQIATIILTHYFQAKEQMAPEAAAARAAEHRVALSHLISARIARATDWARLTWDDVGNQIFRHLISPPVDHWVARYSVPSDSSDKTYTVARKDDGAWGCTCWPYKRGKGQPCKHILRAQANPSWYPYAKPA